MKTKEKVMTTKKSQSKKVNADLIDLAGVNVSDPVGTGTTSQGKTSLNNPSVGGGVRGGRGRSDYESQVAASVIMETERTQSAKGAIRSALSAAFGAPVMPADVLQPIIDANKPLLDGGLIAPDQYDRIINAARLGWQKLHPSPDYSYSMLCDYVREHLSKMWSDFCPFVSADSLGVGSLSVCGVWSWTGSSYDMPHLSPLADGATLSDTITALLSVCVYGEAMQAVALREQTLLIEAMTNIRKGVRLLLRANKIDTNDLTSLTDLVTDLVNEDSRTVARLNVLYDDVLRLSADKMLAQQYGRERNDLRPFYGGLSDYEIGLVGLRTWSPKRVADTVRECDGAIKNKMTEIARLEALLKS